MIDHDSCCQSLTVVECRAEQLVADKDPGVVSAAEALHCGAVMPTKGELASGPTHRDPTLRR